jgi:hypothetical protein
MARRRTGSQPNGYPTAIDRPATPPDDARRGLASSAGRRVQSGEGTTPMSEPLKQGRSAGRTPLAAREADGSTLTCAECGCRLTARERFAGMGPDAAWRHFAGASGHDARGCRVDCVDEPHLMASVQSAAA